MAEINGVVKDGTINKRLWDSGARFVVARASEFSKSQQTEILDSFSKLGIYNCIILSRGHYNIDKKYSSRKKVNAEVTDMILGAYTWFPYQSADRCTEVNDIPLLDSWFISGQRHFTKNTDLFPGKISNNINGCPLKEIIKNAHSKYLTNYIKHAYSNSSVVWYIEGLEYELLRVVLHQMNMTMFHAPTPEEAEWNSNFQKSYFVKETFIALGGFVNTISLNSDVDTFSSYFFISIGWYIPCSIKYQRWNSIFRIFSVELWLVLIISIVTAAVSTTLVGRYSCTSEWQGYKTLTSSLTIFWAVSLGVAVLKMPRTTSLVRCSSPGCVSLWLSVQCSRHFSQRFLLTPTTKHQFKTWMSCSPQVLSLPIYQNTDTDTRMVMKLKHQKYSEIVCIFHHLRFV